MVSAKEAYENFVGDEKRKLSAMVRCKICRRDIGSNGLRFGACWECAEAESIIDEGLDMSDFGPKKVKGNAAKTALEKLEFLIKKGWVPPGGK